MLGGGTWITQNKILPGFYVNVVGTSNSSSVFSDRGKAAIMLPLTEALGRTVVKITASEFITDASTIFKEAEEDVVPDNSMKALREMFKHATTVYIYNTFTNAESLTTELQTAPTTAEIIKALEPYDFNILACYTSTAQDVTAYCDAVETWRDDIGKKVQAVVYSATDPDYEGIINVVSTVSDTGADPHALVAWVAGAEAGCEVNKSCTNMKYDGEYNIICDKSQTELEQCLKDGEFVFHLVYDDIRVLEDVDSLVTTTMDKGEDFKSNQTMRVVDQIANDIAYLFNTKYLGVIPNDEAGRASLWADIVKHHRTLETLRAIENYDSSLLTVERGDTKKAVVINDVVQVVNAMAQCYMTIVVQ